jgi:hypothetical protein
MGIFNIFGVPSGVFVFTIIEAVAFYLGVSIWLRGNPVLGTIVWAVITYGEHAIAYHVGKT